MLNPDFAEESILPALLPHTRVVNGLKNSYWLGFIYLLEQRSPLFYRQCNATDVEGSKLIGHRVTTALSVSSSKLIAIVEEVSDPMTRSHLRFACPLFAVYVDVS